jgi:hypothetical protein
MNEQEIDNIMQKHLKSDSGQINIDKPVMNRIRKYEEKKSSKFLRIEYVLSAVVFLTGIISLISIQSIFDIFITIPQIEQYYFFTRWMFTGIYALIILTTIFVVYFISLLNKDIKMNCKIN